MFKELQSKLPSLHKNVVLAPYTSFNIGGPAKYFFMAKSCDDLTLAMEVVREKNIPIFILGGGTNLLISNNGFDGLVIYVSNKNISFDKEYVLVEAGLSLKKLLDESHARGLGSIEFMAGIPGSVGGAIRGNAGAYGRAIGDFGDVVQEVRVYKDGKVQKYSQKDMDFSYRTSKVKKEGGLILDAKLKLEKKDPVKILEEMKKNLEYRNKKTPSDVQSAGSVFKNIEMNKVGLDIKRIIKELDVTKEEFDEATKFRKLPVSFINDHLGLKGKTIGKAQVSEKHGGYIINTGDATADHVVQLIAFIKTRVRNKLGILLEEEIQYVGF